nr:hypothetical protein CFP56_70982 [Quercus suber]
MWSHRSLFDRHRSQTCINSAGGRGRPNQSRASRSTAACSPQATVHTVHVSLNASHQDVVGARLFEAVAAQETLTISGSLLGLIASGLSVLHAKRYHLTAPINWKG